MDFIFGVIVGGVAVAAFLSYRLKRAVTEGVRESRDAREAAERAAAAGGTSAAGGAGAAGGPAGDTPATADDKAAASQELLRLAGESGAAYEESAVPADLRVDPHFQRGVALLRSDTFTAADCINYYMGANLVLACMALEALMEREEDVSAYEDTILEHLNSMGGWTRDFALRVLSERCKPPLIGRVFVSVDPSWGGRLLVQFLQEFLERQLAAGEEATFGVHLAGRGPEVQQVKPILDQLHGEGAEALQTELAEHLAEAVDVSFLSGFGRILGRKSPGGPPVLRHRFLDRTVDELRRRLVEGEQQRSLAFVGEPGIGKSTTLALLARELTRAGWTVFEANATDIMSGQMFVGSLEGRLQEMLQGIANRPKVLWIIPSFHELLWAGRSLSSPVSLLDHLFPHLESGALRIVAETHPAGLEELLLKKPRLRTALEPVTLESLGEADTLEVVGEWSRERALPDGGAGLEPECHHEAVQLTWQYLGTKAAPGRVLRFLEATRRAHEDAGGEPRALGLDDLLSSLSVLTGIPVDVLDHRASLDLEGLRRFFEKRVLGQPEAVDCLVDRVALVKAGLTDPGRPLGVFLFTGPTGTGKTELAKALSEFLFSTTERLVRIDMSELQTVGDLDRLLGVDRDDTPGATGGALVDAIRHQPFSVVLLDEFEKAHPQIATVFLQLFDDGRLTDRRGRTADFRHAIVIMTSNLGGRPSTGAHVGFRPGGETEVVDHALSQAYPPEFLNRIDRVVRFRPLGRAVMRDILEKELSDAMRRRGLRSRAWAVEWEESAIDFLLRKGFTQDLGARPLRRAVERYLLSPLAKAIVNHQTPAGEQFLFVRSKGNQLQVEFVDPDAPVGPAPTPLTPGAERQLEEIVFQPHGTAAELALLEERTATLTERVQGEEWKSTKQAALDVMKEPSFWQSAGRFPVLGRIEYMDRIETGAETAGSILTRLATARAEGRAVPQKLVGRLAQQLYLVENACAGLADGQPADTFLAVEARTDDDVDQTSVDGFADELVQMYRRWAQKRGMSFEVLDEQRPEGGPYQALLSVSGFGAFRILQPEDGLHVHELPDDGRLTRRCRVRVGVVAQPDEPAADPEAARRQAVTAFAAHERAQRVVRRYRAEPSPLVRDSVRQFKTGLLERVLDGEFDVVGSS